MEKTVREIIKETTKNHLKNKNGLFGDSFSYCNRGFFPKIWVILTLFSQSTFSLATKLGHPNLIFPVKIYLLDGTWSS